MRTKSLYYLNSLEQDDTPRNIIEIIEYIKKCVKAYEKNNFVASEEEKGVLEYLNEKCGTGFKPVESNIKFIRARLNNYTVSNLKEVIDRKAREWKGTKWQMYLRPETLFNATKFESYANGLRSAGAGGFVQRVYEDKELDSLFDNLDEVDL